MNAPNLDSAATFLELLAPAAASFTFQTFDDNEALKRGHLTKVLHGSLDELAKRLAALQRGGAGAFVTVNETDGVGRKKENITRVRAVFVDLDGAPLRPVLGCTLEPHMIVESSPDRYHAYWIVKDLPLDQFSSVQKAIAKRFDGDATVHDLPRVMRLPGFYHQKAEPFLTRIHGVSDRMPYTAVEILTEFPFAKAGYKGNGHDHNGEAEAMAELVRQLLNAATFHAALRSLAWRYLSAGMAAPMVVETLRGFMLTIPEAERDDRWSSRFKEIPRTVSTAQEKQRIESVEAEDAYVDVDAEHDEDPSVSIIEAGEAEAAAAVGGGDQQSAEPEANRWKLKLIRGDKGIPRDCVANGAVILEMDTRFKGQLRFDELHSAPFVKFVPWEFSEKWREWTDVDDLHFARWAQRRGVPLRPTTARDACTLVASKNKHHAVKEYLDGLKWDGQARLNTWLQTYLGAHTAPDEYLHAVAAAFMISAVARIYVPGSKVDHALIFEGPQGTYKSTSVRVLFSPEWFADEISDLGSKDSAQDLRGKWCIEISELSAMRRSQVERVKAFISRRTDHYRPSYGRRSQDFDRQCVFIGTTNSNQYLEDETGGRRFWPVPCGKIDIQAIHRDRDQLWAEAVVRFSAGERWWLNPEIEALAAAEQEGRRVPDAWEQVIADWLVLNPKKEPTVQALLSDAIRKQPDTWTRADTTRVGQCMHALGWKSVRGETCGRRERRYVRRSV
jgi:predicted P-loop ATPase